MTRVCGADRAMLAEVLAGLARYQALPPPTPAPPAAAPVLARAGEATLVDHGSGTGLPLVIVPSLINPPTVLDLSPETSLLAALARAGFRPMLVNWGAPEPLGLAALVETRLLPLMRAVATPSAPVALAGYCLGGTLAVAAAARAGGLVRRLALLATPWHFSGYGDARREALAGWWHHAETLARPLGGVPMDLLQPAFWRLDEAGLVAKYRRLATAEPSAVEAFAQLEDWSNTGPPLAMPAAIELLGALYGENQSGSGRWLVEGEPVDAGRLAMPVLDVVARADRIVPEASALTSDGPGHRLDVASGHVGMIVGRHAPERLWAPLGAWLATAD